MSNLRQGVVVELLKDSMKKGAMPFLTVTSNSMSPLLRLGDEIGLRSVEVSEIRAGDVLVLQEQEVLTTHRFWRTFQQNGQTMLVTRGDRTLHFDPPWSAHQVVGRAVVRRRGQRLLWLDQGHGRHLNAWLARLARWEMRLLSRWGPASDGRLRPSRLLRRIVHGWSWILARTVDLFPARPSRD